MTRSGRAVLVVTAVVLALLGLVGAAIGVFLSVLGDQNLLGIGVAVAISSFAGCGLLLALRRPTNAVGWLMLVIAVSMSGILPVSGYASWALRRPGGAPFTDFATWLSGVAFIPLVTCLGMLLPLLFPDGKLPSRRWRILLFIDLGYALLAGGNAFLDEPIELDKVGGVPNPYAIPALHSFFTGMIAAAAPFTLLGLAGSVAVVVHRFRHARGDLRQQMKYVACALVLAPLPFVTYQVSASATTMLMIFVMPLIPVAIMVAVLRYRLYDIDRIVSRTVSYVVITGVLAGVYVGCVSLLTDVLPFDGDVGTAASVLVAVALFAPLRRRVQNLVDRRFNRARYDASAITAAFGARLREQVDLGVVRSGLLDAVAVTVQPAHASLWLRGSR